MTDSTVVSNAAFEAVVDAFDRMSIAEQLEVIANHGHVVVDNNEMPEFANIDGEWVSFDALGEWFANHEDQYQNYTILGVDLNEEKRNEDFDRQDNIIFALSALILVVLVVIPFIVFGEV